jgi:hypothetical protein
LKITALLAGVAGFATWDHLSPQDLGLLCELGLLSAITSDGVFQLGQLACLARESATRCQVLAHSRAATAFIGANTAFAVAPVGIAWFAFRHPRSFGGGLGLFLLSVESLSCVWVWFKSRPALNRIKSDQLNLPPLVAASSPLRVYLDRAADFLGLPILGELLNRVGDLEQSNSMILITVVQFFSTFLLVVGVATPVVAQLFEPGAQRPSLPRRERFIAPPVSVLPRSVRSPAQCGGLPAVLAAISEGVPSQVGNELYEEWYAFGAAQVGCPNGPPRRVDGLYLEFLQGGISTPSIDVAPDAGQAALVFSELAPWLVAHVDEIQLVFRRESFGFGDMQAMQTSRGCQLFIRRFGDGSYLQLPVSALPSVATMARSLRALPFLAANPVTRASGTTTLRIGFLRPLSNGTGVELYEPHEFVVDSLHPTLTCAQLLPPLSSTASSLQKIVELLGLATPVIVAGRPPV